jgi:hypothetical protein
LRSILLESDRLDKFHELRFFFFDRSARAGDFEEPSAPITPRPRGQQPRIRADHIDAGKIRIVIFHRNDCGLQRGSVGRGQSDLLTPAINIVGIASTVAGKVTTEMSILSPVPLVAVKLA